MKKYKTITVPERFIDIANQYTGVIGFSMADARSFNTPTYQKDGSNYAIVANWFTNEYIEFAMSELFRPDYDFNSELDMDKARSAQALVDFTGQDVLNKITILDGTVYEVTQALGLEPIPMDEI